MKDDPEFGATRAGADALIRHGDLAIPLTRKNIKHLYLNVHPPKGRITLVAPTFMRAETIEAFVASRFSWIKRQQAKIASRPWVPPIAFVEGETHFLWGRPYVLSVATADAPASVRLADERILLTVRPRSSVAKRAATVHEWHKHALHEAIPAMIATWEPRLGVHVREYFLQRMKTKWGTCNYRDGKIRLNTELVKRPKHLLEYVVVHEMLHLLEPSHNKRFYSLFDRHYPAWREARAELNARRGPTSAIK